MNDLLETIFTDLSKILLLIMLIKKNNNNKIFLINISAYLIKNNFLLNFCYFEAKIFSRS